MRLSALLQGEPALPAGFDPLVRGLGADSRALAEGDAFVALAGATTHGLRHLPQARACCAAYHCSMLSGGTSISRNAPSITRWNTGADTAPPPYSRPCGSWITTDIAKRGRLAGTSPTNTAA